MFYERIVATMGMPFTVIYLLLLIASFYYLFCSLPKTLRTKNWPIAAGAVISSALSEGQRITKNGGIITVYSAKIEYEYTVGDTSYSSTKIKWIDHRSSNKAQHETVVESYAKGQEVDVYYDPNKPSIGILEPGFDTGNLIAILFLVLSFGSMTAVLLSKL